MNTKNIVFIAQSIDGYIADKNGGIEWLNAIPNPDNINMGFNALMERIDAIVMGRNTFETLCSFDIDWPYTVPVFVLSNALKAIPAKFQSKAELISESPAKVAEILYKKGFQQLYIDGGKTIQSFLQADLIDEMIITTIPVLLGGGVSLFGELKPLMNLKLVKSEVFLKAIVQSTYIKSN